ncbi:MAG: YopX family protein [Candidatus Heimdallarchaeota archaeon]
MNEIKFRSWDEEDKRFRIYDLKTVKGCSRLAEDVGNENLTEAEQFTGLLWDMEKGIYEGDIVKTDDGIIGKIVYERGMYIVVSRDFEDGYERLFEFHTEDCYCDLEVIGNIYENKELLK